MAPLFQNDRADIDNFGAQHRRLTTRFVRLATAVAECLSTLTYGWWAAPLRVGSRTRWLATIGF